MQSFANKKTSCLHICTYLWQYIISIKNALEEMWLAKKLNVTMVTSLQKFNPKPNLYIGTQWVKVIKAEAFLGGNFHEVLVLFWISFLLFIFHRIKELRELISSLVVHKFVTHLFSKWLLQFVFRVFSQYIFISKLNYQKKNNSNKLYLRKLRKTVV